MAYIQVDHQQLDKAADAVEAYITKQNRKMNEMDSSIRSMHSFWTGSDYQLFLQQWDRISANDSVSERMIQSFQHYSDFLRFASKKYQDAQSNEVNRANRLPRW